MSRFSLLAALALLATAVHAQSLTAYPNPLADGPLTVRYAAPEASVPAPTFEVYDLLGRRLDLGAEHAAGVYLWRLRHADGSASEAQRLTRLTAGSLEVHLVRTPEARPLAATVRAKAEGGAGCAPTPGGVLFGGFYHAPALGTALARGATLRVQGASGAGLSTCLPGVGGISAAFPAGASPFKGTDEELQAVFGGTVSGQPFSASVVFEPNDEPLAGGGTSTDLRGGLDASQPRLVEVLRYDASGAPQVVASAVIPGGTPLATPFGRVSAAGAYELRGIAATGWKIEEGESLRDSVFSAQFDFRTVAPGGLTFQIPGATVQGDALALTAQIDGVISLGLWSMDASTTEFEVSTFSMTTPVSGVAQVETAIPAWNEMPNPADVFSRDAETGGFRIGCGAGEACETYGLRAMPFHSSGSANPTVFHKGNASTVSQPSASAISGGGFESSPGRGLLTARDDRFETAVAYEIQTTGDPAPVARSLRVAFGKPRQNKVTLRVDDEDTAAPGFTQYELLYIRNGRVRLQRVFVPGRTYTFKADMEIESFITFGAEATTLTGDVSLAPVLRYGIRLAGGDEYLEVRPRIAGTTLGYTEVEWTYVAPWSFGFASTGSATPTVLMEPLAAGEGGAFEIE